MPIIDQAKGQQGPAGQQPQAPQAGPPQEAAEQGGQPSEQAKDVFLACMGMLYDERIGVGAKLAEQIKGSRDPAGIIANSAHDITTSAIEKTGLALAPQEFKLVASKIVERLAELADAVGVQLTEDDAIAAAEMMRERAGEGAQEGPPPQEQMGAPQ